MGILIVIAVVWLAVRLVALVRMVASAPDDEFRWQDCQDAPAAGSGTTRSVPQDARPDLQDSTPTADLGVAVWRVLVEVARELAARRLTLAETLREDGSPAPTGDPRREWLAALRETIADSVPRPDGGPACLGGREDDAYLRGWDDAVDWISQGRDAASPTWGGVAYMTGWNDAVRDVGRARRFARTWPTPR